MTSIFRCRLHFPHLAEYRNTAHFKRLTFNLYLFTITCITLYIPRGPAHVRRNCLSGKRASDRNTFQNARTYQFEDHTSLCQNHVQESHGGYEGIKEQAEGLEAGIRYDEI